MVLENQELIGLLDTSLCSLYGHYVDTSFRKVKLQIRNDELNRVLRKNLSDLEDFVQGAL